jgi:hypothetical protein
MSDPRLTGTLEQYVLALVEQNDRSDQTGKVQMNKRV